LSLQDDKDSRRRKTPLHSETKPSSEPHRSRRRRPDGEVGSALRSAYDRVVDEDIPPEMLDLLGKLG